MTERHWHIQAAEDIARAIEQGGKRAGFEPERARTWGWFVLVKIEDTCFWQWVQPCSDAESYLFRQLFAEEKISGEPKVTQTGMCILAV